MHLGWGAVVFAVGMAVGPLAFADSQARPLKPIASPVKVIALAPPAVAPNATGQVVISEGSLEYLIGVALRLAANDAAADAHALMLLMQQLNAMRGQLRELERACEAQRAQGKPCEHEAAIATARAEIAALEREVAARQRQSAEERVAQLASDLGRIEDELRRALGSLRGSTALLPAAPGKSIPRAALTTKTQQALDQVVARRGALTPSSVKTTADAGAPKQAK